MSFHYILQAGALSLLLCACHEKVQTPEPPQVTIHVSLPAETRIALSEAANHQAMHLAWQTGDQLSVNGQSFVVSQIYSDHEADFQGPEPSGSSYTLIYPGKYGSAETFNARSYVAQVQSGNASTAHLEYNAMLSGVSAYQAPVFDATWAAEKGGSFAQNAVLQLRLKLPESVSTAYAVTLSAPDAIFPTTNAGTTLAQAQSLTLGSITLSQANDHTLEAYMMISAAGVSIPEGEVLTVSVDTPDKLYERSFTLPAQQWEGGKQYTIQAKIQEETPQQPERGIRNAADFAAFAAAVNAGESTARWENEEGWVNLLADIDFTGVTDWTPVGNAVAPWTNYNPVITSGHAFTGKFDGNAHKIKNLALVDNVTTPGAHFGLFGYVGKGAVVQNFVIDQSCSLTVNSSVSHSAGVIAGVVYDATVRDVTSYAPMTYQGHATGYLHMALIGGIYASESNCTVDSVHNNGKMVAGNTDNLNAGATGIHVAGIVGFSNADTTGGKTVTISSCNNYGDMESQAGRTAGIVGAANASTLISGCENRGNQLNTMPKEDGGRLANIVCMTSNGSSISACKNYGNLISTTKGRVGGIVSLANAGTYTDNENYGEIISDSPYRGVFFGYVNQVTTWTGGKASGKVGQYNNGTYEYDLYAESNKEKYLGLVGTSGQINASGIIYDIVTGEDPVNPDPDLDVTATLRILCIGNSFTKDAVEHLPAIMVQAGVSDVQIVHMYYGGRTIPEYVSGWSTATDYKCYVCNPGASGWSELTGKSLAQVAVTGKWDVVTIQEHTGRRLAWGYNQTELASELASAQDLVNLVKSAQTSAGGSPRLYYILSQAYHDLSKAQNTQKNFTTTDEMWTVIASVGEAIVEGCGFDGVISTGVMLQNLRTSPLNNSNGLTRDGYHMDYGISRFGAACAVFETLISPVKNVLLDGIVAGPTTDSFTGTAWTTAVTAERAAIALQAARLAIAKPYEVTDMSSGSGGDDTNAQSGLSDLPDSEAYRETLDNDQ